MQLQICTSTITDGTMKSADQSYVSILPMREAFLQKHSISPKDTTLVQVVYEGDSYRRYKTLDGHDKGDGIIRQATIASDGLVVTKPNHALFLPLADCIGVVLHDPTKNLLMVSHLGRHNLEQNGGMESVNYLVEKHDVNPSDLTVWLSPAAGKDYYPLYAFNNRELHDVAIEQIKAAGILPNNITASPIDSAADQNYFSHSQFLKGNRKTDGRFAIVATLD